MVVRETIENLKIVQCQHTQIGRTEIKVKWGEDNMGQKILPEKRPLNIICKALLSIILIRTVQF